MASAFNPDDFILHEITSPDDRKTLMEYDAAHRMILLRMKTVGSNDVDYKFKSIYVSKNINNSFLTNLDDRLHNSNDRVVVFGIYEDGSYDLVKERMKFDLNTKTTRWIKYECTNWSIADAKEFYDGLKAMLFAEQVLETKAQDDAILDIVNKQEFFDLRYYEHCEERDQLLRDSDHTVLDDYPEKFEGEKELWKQYRVKLNEIVRSSTDFEDSLEYIEWCETFKWPVDPCKYIEAYPEKEVEYLATDDQYGKTLLNISSKEGQRISSQLGKSARRQALRNAEGISVEKQIMDVIEKYKLFEDVLDFDVNTLTVRGE